MFLTATIRPIATPLSNIFFKYMLETHLPTLAIRWWQNVERISGGIISLKVDPAEAISVLRTKNPRTSGLARSIIVPNSQWNIVWGLYCVELLKPVGGVKRSKWGIYLSRQFEGIIKRNTAFLKGLDEEPAATPELELVKRGGISGIDLIAADLVANTYTDKLWGELVGGLDAFTSFRHKYIQQYTGAKFQADADSATIAKSIVLAEIAWSNDFFPFRDVSDMVSIEFAWRLYYKDTSGIFGTFIRAANLMGANLPELSSKEIIQRIARNPNAPIEEVLS